MKFLHLFGKSIGPPVRHVRQVSPRQVSSAAQETARKIDAIESEICAEFDADSATASAAPATTPERLLAQRIDEASLLYASRQPQAAEALLRMAIAQSDAGARAPLAWMMLLELANIEGSQLQFEELALHYAQRFETSPPQWRVISTAAAAPAVQACTLRFRGELSGRSAPALAQFAQMAGLHAALRIDLNGVTGANSEGCRLLLNLLKQWLSDGRQIELLPATALIDVLHTQLDRTPGQQSGAVDDSDWRLLMELLRVSRGATAYEEICVAYSVAWEISPPAPLLPQPMGSTPAQSPKPRSLLMPAEITYPVDALLASLQASAAALPAIVLDCNRLQRIEFNAAAPLLAGITRLADGKPVEWRDISHLVSTLLQLVGGAERLRIVNRKP